MKLKYSICAVMLAASMALLPQSTLAVEAPLSGAPGAETDAAPAVVYEEVTPQLEHAAKVNENEQVVIPANTLIDLILPETLNGETITRIGEGCFKCCEVIRSVTIPATITEIGADAFADCPYLEVIYFADRADAEALTLGENWSGNAEVEFLLVAVEEDEPQADIEATEPSEATATETSDKEVTAPTDEQSEPSDGSEPADDDVPSDESSEPTDGSTEGTEPPSDATGTEAPAVADDAAAGEGTPPSEDQPSDASEGAATEPATEPAAEPAAAEAAE